MSSSSSSSYALVNDLDEDDSHALDYGFPSTIQTTGVYTSSVHTIFARHTADIRSATEPILQPLHHIAKKRIRELVATQNKELFGFLQHPERTPNSQGLAESIFRKYGYDVPIPHRNTALISRELNLDVSMSEALTAIESSMNKACCNQDMSTIPYLATQLKWIYSQYKQVGEEVLRLEALLAQKTEMLDKLQQRTPLLTQLASNESLPPLLDAFHTYMKEVFQANKFEETYKELAEAYKKWHILREIVAVQQLTVTTTEPLCAVCLTDPVGFAVVPCGHTFCGGCARRMGLSCFLCRGSVREKIRVFFT